MFLLGQFISGSTLLCNFPPIIYSLRHNLLNYLCIHSMGIVIFLLEHQQRIHWVSTSTQIKVTWIIFIIQSPAFYFIFELVLGLEPAAGRGCVQGPNFEWGPFVVKRAPFAGWALNQRCSQREPKNSIDVGHTGRCCGGLVGASAKQELQSRLGPPLPFSLPHLPQIFCLFLMGFPSYRWRQSTCCLLVCQSARPFGR